jgi:hypothetical protein
MRQQSAFRHVTRSTQPLIVSGADDRFIKLWRMGDSKVMRFAACLSCVTADAVAGVGGRLHARSHQQRQQRAVPPQA